MSIPRPLEPPPTEAAGSPRGRFGGGAGPRFFLLTGAGLAWSIPALWNRTFLYAMLVWDALLLVAFVADWLRLPHPRQLTVRREWNRALSIGVSSPLSISVNNQSGVPLQIKVLDELPPSALHEIKIASLSIPPGATKKVTLHYTPGTRGDRKTGRVFLRYQSPFQMAERWAVADLEQTVRVYPN